MTVSAFPVLSLASFLLHLSISTGPCQLPSGKSPTRLVTLSGSGMELEVPAAWSEVVEEHHGMARIEDDRDRGCRVVLTINDGADAATRIRRVHERLYLDSSLIEGTCGEERIRRHSKREKAVFGEYDRGRRKRVFGMFWSVGTAGYAALYSCPRGVAGDWRVALPLLSSIRQTAP